MQCGDCMLSLAWWQLELLLVRSAGGSGWHESEWCLTRQGWRSTRCHLDEPEIAGRRICCCRQHPECMTAISDHYKLKPECKRAFGVVIFPTGEQITTRGGIIRTIKRNFGSFLRRLLFFSLLIVEDKGLRALFLPYFVLLTATIAGRYENAPRLVMEILSAGVSEADKEKLGHYAPRNLYGSH